MKQFICSCAECEVAPNVPVTTYKEKQLITPETI